MRTRHNLCFLFTSTNKKCTLVSEAKGAIGHVQIEDSTTERCDRVKKTQKIARVYNGATMMCPTSISVICV